MWASGFAVLMIAVLAAALPVSGGVTKAATGTKCPGAFRANQHMVGGARTVWTVASEDKNRKDKWWPVSGSMGVHVIFQGDRVPMRTLEFSVSYLPPGGRRTPAGRESNDVQELKKNYTLAVRDKVQVEADLLVGPASAVTRVHLVSAVFADESEWHAASEDACSVQPDRVLAVDGKESSLVW